jgi:hypothetical protein
VGRDHPLAPLRGRIVDHEQATAEAVDLAGEGDTQLVATGRDRMRKGKRHGLCRSVGRDLRCSLAFNRCRHDRHVDCVEDQTFGRLPHINVD